MDEKRFERRAGAVCLNMTDAEMFDAHSDAIEDLFARIGVLERHDCTSTGFGLDALAAALGGKDEKEDV